MKSFLRRLAVTAVMALAVLYCGSARAEDVSTSASAPEEKQGPPALLEVPDSLDERYRNPLAEERNKLLWERGMIGDSISEHNAKNVEEGSAEEAKLLQEGEELRAKMERHVKASEAFNKKVIEAGKINETFSKGLANPVERWIPLNAPLTNKEGNRNAYDCSRVIDQFQVEKSARYKPGKKTYCNIFAWDVTRAMGAEIPHYVIKGDKTGASAVDELGNFKVKKADREELNANATVQWLRQHGQENGWRRVDARMAQEMAKGGQPAVAIWPNPDPELSGHVVVIRPGSVPVNKGGVAIAQAGRDVLDANHLEDGLGAGKRKTVQYWCHE